MAPPTPTRRRRRGTTTRRRQLLGLLLTAAAPAAALAATTTASSTRYTLIPDVDPYPRLGPSDDGYPGNLPANLPSSLPQAPPVLVEGQQSECAEGTTVEAVLRDNGRKGMIALLRTSPIGAQVLSGRAMATVLAPPDDAIAALRLSPADVKSNPLLATTFSNYHVVQGLRPLGVMAADPLRNWNTTLSDAYCPTAYQTVSSLTRATAAGGALDSAAAAAAAQEDVFLRSAVTTARVVQPDLVACNSVVHLIDRVLDPCCRSLWEQLPQLSVVSLTPSYFDGFKAPPPPGNDDASNRRIFEEQLLDSLLYMTYRNSTRTVLWPAPSAWDGFSLARALGPSVPLDSLAARTRALKMLALYGLSYGQLLLPKDYGLGAADAAPPPPALSFVSALQNVTTSSVWRCKGGLTLLPGKAGATATPQAAVDTSQANTGRPAGDGMPATALTKLAPAPAASGEGVVLAPKRAPASPRVLPASGPVDGSGGGAAAAEEEDDGGIVGPARAPAPKTPEAPASPAFAPAQPKSAGGGGDGGKQPAAAPAPPTKSAPAPSSSSFLVEDADQIGDGQDYSAGVEEAPAAPVAPAPAPAPAAPAQQPARAAVPAAAAKPAPAPAAAPAAAAAAAAPAATPAPAAATATTTTPAPAPAAAEPLAAAAAAASSAAPAPVPTLLVGSEGGGERRRRRSNQRRRRRLAQAGTQQLTIVGTYETCEGIRILLVDSVPVPCDFPELVKSAKTVEAQMDAFALPVRQTVESYYTDLKKMRGGAGLVGGRVVGSAGAVVGTTVLGAALMLLLLLLAV
jgi:uncharacterized surface protein with fasciclin (FAS1) repeats